MLLLYILHILVTVIWVGGLAAGVLIASPVSHKVLNPEIEVEFAVQWALKVQQGGWFCLAILAVTGMFQLSGHPLYRGFLAIENSWAVAILVKHILIGILVILEGYQTWGLMPSLQRINLKAKAGVMNAETRLRIALVSLKRTQIAVLALILFILCLTAWARTASL